MTTDDMELIHGSGNVFRDMGRPNADIEQLKCILAAQIIRLMDEQGLSTRQAEAATGVPYSDFSRIRRARLDRFTIDRLMGILNRFDQEVDVDVQVRPVGHPAELPDKPGHLHPLG